MQRAGQKVNREETRKKRAIRKARQDELRKAAMAKLEEETLKKKPQNMRRQKPEKASQNIPPLISLPVFRKSGKRYGQHAGGFFRKCSCRHTGA